MADEQGLDLMKELGRLRDATGKVIGQVSKEVQSAVQIATSAQPVRVDVYEVGDEVVVQTNPLDNLDAKSIEVSMEGDVLSIRGETIAPDVDAAAVFLIRERKFGVFDRTVQISVPVRSDEAKAKLSKTGVLTIRIPVDRAKSSMGDIEVTEID
ncbi:MAG: Hsp20/alpha crystallin family protein [Phototrophicaceae bacterium]